MGLPGLDYEGGKAMPLKKEDSGQSVKGGAKPSSEQIAAWGGIKESEVFVDQDKETPVRLKNDNYKPDS